MQTFSLFTFEFEKKHCIFANEEECKNEAQNCFCNFITRMKLRLHFRGHFFL